MSRLYFHSPSGDAELQGSERAWLRHLAEGPSRGAWNLDGPNDFDRAVEILAMVPDVPDGAHGANYLHRQLREAQEQDASNSAVYKAWKPGEAFSGPIDHEPLRQLVRSLKTRLRLGDVDLDVDGHRLRSANLDLNTALIAGSDPVRVAAKLSGWCESHTWVDGPDRAWLADIIDAGLRTGMYRRGLWYSDQPNGPRDKWSDQGWDVVLELLRARDDEPVVTSSSFGDQFPNAEIAGWEPTIDPNWVPAWATDHDGAEEWAAMSDGDRDEQRRDHALDGWYDLPAEEQWRLGMEGLRRERPWARLASDTLAEVMFGPPVTVFDLFAPDRDERVRAACALEMAT